MSLKSALNSVRIVADDLTGACDTAVAFACVGMVTEVETSWSVRTSTKAQVIAWNTESRDIKPAVSLKRIQEAAARLADDASHHVFKKVDSIFRGNTFAEIAACLATIPHEVAILAPAFPELGRTLRDGRLTMEDFSGRHHLDIFQSLVDAGLAPHKVSDASSLRDAYETGARLLLCDSESQEDLTAIVQSSLDLKNVGRVLWIGSGGLARALASTLGANEVSICPVRTGTKVLFAIGSDHPVTLRQLEYLKLEQGNTVIIPIERGISPVTLRDKLLPYADKGVSCLFATGGDTALAVCHALEIDRLRVECEFSRGLPQSCILGGPFDGAHFIMKSGGFGEHDVLARIAQTFAVA